LAIAAAVNLKNGIVKKCNDGEKMSAALMQSDGLGRSEHLGETIERRCVVDDEDGLDRRRHRLIVRARQRVCVDDQSKPRRAFLSAGVQLNDHGWL
jgi:hypothetical protein